MLGRHLQGPIQGNLWLLASLSPWVYSSAVERLTADQQVPGSNPGEPFFWTDSKRAVKRS